MTDDKSAKDSARDPEREALGSVSGGIRAAAKKAAKKVAKKIAKKAGQKKTTKKTASAARTTKKAAKAAARRDKPASGRTGAPASGTGSARASTAKSAAAGARAETAPKTGGSDTAAAASSGGIASAATPPENGPSFEAPRPPAPAHPGASLDSMHEHTGGFGSMLALWGPLIIVGFLVLVFRGGDEREETAAVGSDAASQATAGMPDDPVRGPWAGDAVELAAGTRAVERLPGSPGAGRGAADAFDSGFTMRTSMASPPAYAGRGPGGRMPASARARLYPSPPGPYREPRYRGLPTGESWSTSSSEWLWPADAPGASGYEDGGDQSVQWVRCAPPYYWCPAPSKPAW